MLVNRQKEQSSFYHRISLPKTINPANKSVSTRCISVNKAESKPVALNNTNNSKQPLAPPKPLTVRNRPLSIILERATTRDWSEKFLDAELLGVSPRTAPQLL